MVKANRIISLMEKTPMADFEFKDVPSNGLPIPPEIKLLFWAWFDANKDKEFKLKWGWFKLSFKIAVLEPLFIQIIGPRP